jgi:type II secretory pathway pseudopilin PulG
MTKKQKNESGFSLIEIGLVLAVFLMIGFTGWFVWHGKQSTTSKLSEKVAASSSLSKIQTNAQNQSKAVATGTSSTAATSSTSVKPKTSSGSSAPTTPSPTHPTYEEIQQAKSQAQAIHSLLAAYYADYGYYTESLDSSTLINQPGSGGATASTFVAPQGTRFSYTCTKGGPIDGVDRCAGYILYVLKTSDGSVLQSIRN